MNGSNGTPLRVGQDVAYNWSGTVTRGRIVRLNPEASGYSATRVWIRALSGYPKGSVSKVRDPHTILPLEP